MRKILKESPCRGNNKHHHDKIEWTRNYFENKILAMRDWIAFIISKTLTEPRLWLIGGLDNGFV